MHYRLAPQCLICRSLLDVAFDTVLLAELPHLFGGTTVERVEVFVGTCALVIVHAPEHDPVRESHRVKDGLQLLFVHVWRRIRLLEALATYLTLETEAFKSYIVFSERCSLKKVPPNTRDYTICKRNRLLGAVREDVVQSTVVFSTAQFKRLKAALTVLSEKSTQDALIGHVEEAKQFASGDICPWCGSELVRRDGKYGPFMGLLRHKTYATP